MANIVLLLIQAAFGLAGLYFCGRRVFAAAATSTDRARHAVASCIAAAVIALAGAPIIVTVSDTNTGEALLAGAIVASVAISLIGLAVALMLRSSDRSLKDQPQGFDIAVWIGVAALLMLLAGAGTLTIPIGQTALAIGIVLIWLNSPAHDPHQRTEKGPGWSVTLLPACAAAQVLAMALMNEAWRPIGLVVLIAWIVLIALRGVVALAGAGIAPQRFIGWLAAYSALFVLGGASLATLVIRALVITGQATPDGLTTWTFFNVADGLGVTAAASCAMLLIPLVVLPARSLPASVRLAVGIGLAALGAVLLGWAVALFTGDETALWSFIR